MILVLPSPGIKVYLIFILNLYYIVYCCNRAGQVRSRKLTSSWAGEFSQSVGVMYSPGYAGYGGGLAAYRSQPTQYYGQSYSYRSAATLNNCETFSLCRNTDRGFNYSSSQALTSPYLPRRTTIPTRGLSIPPTPPPAPTRGLSIPPAGLSSRSVRQRTVARLTAEEDILTPENR